MAGMAIAGIGVDVVDLARFERALSRTPALRDRLFAVGERDRPVRSLAARFAAKEAFLKALGESTGIRWHDMRVVQDGRGAPILEVSGAAATLVDARGIVAIHLSVTHDAGVAVATVVCETA